MPLMPFLIPSFGRGGEEVEGRGCYGHAECMNSGKGNFCCLESEGGVGGVCCGEEDYSHSPSSQVCSSAADCPSDPLYYYCCENSGTCCSFVSYQESDQFANISMVAMLIVVGLFVGIVFGGIGCMVLGILKDPRSSARVQQATGALGAGGGRSRNRRSSANQPHEQRRRTSSGNNDGQEPPQQEPRRTLTCNGGHRLGPGSPLLAQIVSSGEGDYPTTLSGGPWFPGHPRDPDTHVVSIRTRDGNTSQFQEYNDGQVKMYIQLPNYASPQGASSSSVFEMSNRRNAGQSNQFNNVLVNSAQNVAALPNGSESTIILHQPGGMCGARDELNGRQEREQSSVSSLPKYSPPPVYQENTSTTIDQSNDAVECTESSRITDNDDTTTVNMEVAPPTPWPARRQITQRSSAPEIRQNASWFSDLLRMPRLVGRGSGRSGDEEMARRDSADVSESGGGGGNASRALSFSSTCSSSIGSTQLSLVSLDEEVAKESAPNVHL